ncbi:CDP-diacylglycerol--glycerol-3-phosphate 3-phosphatidyltransferase [Caulobacter endophyticus]|uniref:CDP-diacylglycerol--glycerol-3-phosphate 3-phosphatidyltransferase n=1 Tax=Caulobacter endophyticus TaxID=2172652 RepID=A0A2T9KBU8_9CAUL|nr:CDP-diacylglycerol--glycerol-3-phosphate 3-phosphatidyltransferase [Caulobacter endophyticus]PVM93321.1 CDP-diacylglycerol--glycerol-3-phosphate 3-phosphatidyltransferase [Caulobacter endophyticus]
MKALPNILTSARLVIALFMFVALAAAAGGVPWFSEQLTADQQFSLQRWAFWAFAIAAITDFFDGWLARKLDAVSIWGAILDPIGDKILVCGALLGLMALGPNPLVILPAGLILFREFAVSALREVGAGKGIKLPVTLLAKWKTTLQLVAIGGELVVVSWGAFDLPQDPAFIEPVSFAVHGLLWIAAIVTLITGAQYWEAARKALA